MVVGGVRTKFSVQLWSQAEQFCLSSPKVHLRDGVKKKTDYLVTSIKRVGRYLAEITIS